MSNEFLKDSDSDFFFTSADSYVLPCKEVSHCVKIILVCQANDGLDHSYGRSYRVCP